MKKTCDNCYNYLKRNLDLFPMYRCVDAEFDPSLEKYAKKNGEGCPNWHEQMKMSVNGKRRY